MNREMVKHTPQFLQKLEYLLAENNYMIRNERGNFKSGYCILEEKRVIVMNKFATIESRINTLVEILKDLNQRNQLNEEAVEVLKKTVV